MTDDRDRLRQILDGHGGTLPPEAGQIRRILADEFGQRHGLTQILREYEPQALAEMAGPRRWGRLGPHDWYHTATTDHPQFFTDADGRAAMVTCHNYSWHPDAIREFARRHGLVALIDPQDREGWWWPGGPTYLIVYRPTTARPLDGLEPLEIK